MGTLVHCRWEHKNAAAAVGKKFWQFPHKLNMEMPYDSAIPLLGVYPEELKSGVQTSTPMWMF